MTDLVVYAVYYTAATDTYKAGYVWNNILVPSDGSPPTVEGSLSVQDAERKYPIGSTYTASAS
ncbi:MAG: hypothetical protein ABF689_06895 [Gluconobacter cerinus]|uniref:hypothetical protein n=1 Tax=Gluconobacter cerinus TaxID=38307 RepID=UPI0039ECF335